jgi:hypothetical protein
MSLLNFFGDVYLDRPRPANVPLAGDYILNLESPLTRSSRPVPGKINLKSEGIYFKDTFGKNPLAVCLANNHIMDYGAEGFRETVDYLQVQNIRFFGAGCLADHCRNPLILELAGQRIALLGYVCPSTQPVFAADGNYGVAPIRVETIAADMLLAQAAGAERVIVQLHWGEEDVGLPRPADVKTARRIVELGADLVIGHHAHCIQPFEVYRGRYIFYGLGNTLFPDTVMESYAPDGRRRHNRQMAWDKRNRRSLAVAYDTVSGAVAMRLLSFKDVLAVVPGVRPERVFAFRKSSDSLYRMKYAWVLRLSLLRRLGMSFLSRPRLPKRENLRWLADRFRTHKKG